LIDSFFATLRHYFAASRCISRHFHIAIDYAIIHRVFFQLIFRLSMLHAEPCHFAISFFFSITAFSRRYLYSSFESFAAAAVFSRR
jgi:hypothetical protein